MQTLITTTVTAARNGFAADATALRVEFTGKVSARRVEVATAQAVYEQAGTAHDLLNAKIKEMA